MKGKAELKSKKRWGILLLSLIIGIIATGYAIGAYFVDYALKRGNAADPLAPPAMLEELFATCRGKKDKLIVAGAGHGDAMVTDRETYWKSIFDFLSVNE